LFLLTVLTVVGWVGAISLALSSAQLAVTILLGRLAFSFATLMPFILLWLFTTFHADQYRSSPIFKLSAFLCATFSLLSFSPWVVSDAITGTHRPNFVYGPLHPFLGAYVVLCLAYALTILARTIAASTGLRRLQLLYLLAGVTLGGIGIIATNLVIPLVWKTSYYSIFGPYFTLAFNSFAAHAIVRHRLMDVRLFVRNGVVYASAIALVSLLFIVLATATMRFLYNRTDFVSLTTALTIALLVAIVFQPLKNFLHRGFNHYLYRRSYDYQRSVRDVSRQLSKSLDPSSLLSYLVLTLSRLLQCEFVAAYLATPSEHSLSCASTHGAQDADRLPRTLSYDSALVFHLRQGRVPLLREELETTRDAPDFARVGSALSALSADVAFPLFHDNDLTGLILLGSKRSGDAYFSEDLDLITTLLSQASIALNNAQLYSQILLAHEHIENILATMESAVIAVARDQVITLFNAAGGRLLGRTPPEVKGQSLSILPSALADPIRATLSDGVARLQVESTFTPAPSLASVSVILSTSTLRDRAGEILGVVAVVSDTTKLKRLELEKRRSERLASIGVFAAGIAHEIKNPLVAIKTFAELLPERFADEDFRDQFSQVAVTEIERIDELVDRLRSLATPQPQRLVPIAVCETIDETLLLLRGHIERSKIDVATSYPEAPCLIYGDRSQLKQLFLNLLLNALEAMPSGGRLSISVSKSDSHQASTVVQIRDSGDGLQVDMIDKIFDPFMTTKPNGSGLGLSICRGIVDAHRAEIALRNNADGPGATVLLEFPHCDATPLQLVS
jgi:PAS domain S-box-containing protein